MSESSALQWLRAPKLAEDALPTDSLIVECRRCGRSVPVSMSPLRPPGFLHVEDQVECPEVQERWAGRGEGGLLLMMCGALEHSLDAGWADEADAHRDSIVAPEPSLHARPAPEQVDVSPETWNEHREHDIDDAGEPGGLQSQPVRSGRRWLAHLGTAVGLLIMVGIGAGSALLLLRDTRTLQSAAVPGSSVQKSAGLSILPSGRPTMLGLAAAPPAAQESPAATRSLSSSSAVQRPAPATEATPNPPAVAAAPALAAVAEPAPAPEPKLRAPEMVAIAGSTFAMGGDDDSEQPAHQVTIRPFALGKYPVTVGEWKQCVAAGSCADIASGADDRPVTNVSYDDAQSYLGWLAKVTGKPFRLPTEAEWEYAARGGQRSKFWWGDRMRAGMAGCKGCNNNDADDAAPPKVGSFQANPFGLFDMGGGVGQWVADNWHKNYRGAPADGSAWLDDGSYSRVIRSGSWRNGPGDARAGSRDRYDGRIRHPTLGFRVALSP
jgi:formylglycine-generating enzyme required for sulfatase activity